MYCPNCGTLNQLGAESCVNCKKLLPKPESLNESPPPPPQNPNPNSPPPEKDYYPGQPGSQYSYSPAGNYGQASGYGTNFIPAATAVGYAPAYPGVYSGDRIGVAQHDAGFWVRLGAWIIDSIIVGLVSLIIVGIPQMFYWTGFATRYGSEISRTCPSGPSYSHATEQACNNLLESIFLDRGELSQLLTNVIGFGLVAGLLSLVYYVGMTAYGATIGKKVFGLKVVKPDGTPPGFGRALLRQTVGYWVSGAVFYLGFIWVALDEHKQGWHDKIAGTYVVRA